MVHLIEMLKMTTEINVVVELEGGSSESQLFKRMLRMWKNQSERRFLSREEPYRRRRCLIVQLNIQPLSTTKKRLVSINPAQKVLRALHLMKNVFLS